MRAIFAIHAHLIKKKISPSSSQINCLPSRCRSGVGRSFSPDR
jgi:hypothetical protein